VKFQKGQSGNSGGRPKEDQRVNELAREYTDAAIAKLAELMKWPDDPRVQLNAAVALLDRAYGRPAQAHAGPDGEGPMELIQRIERHIVDPKNSDGAGVRCSRPIWDPHLRSNTSASTASLCLLHFPSASTGSPSG